MECLFCNNGKQFNTKEHIIPESLGNDDLILEREVCDKCQNYLSQIENYVLSKTPLGFWRTLLTIRTKKGTLPKVDFTKSKNTKGALPDYHKEHDDVKFESQSDFTTELNFQKPIEDFVNKKSSGKIKYVITPKAIHEIGRFLGKIGIELLCYSDRLKARDEEFDSLRRYVREGSLKDLWPLFYKTEGEINSLFTYLKRGSEIEEQVTCYSYSIKQIGPYNILNLKVGTDSWFICLNQQFPHPDIYRYMGENVKCIWYSKAQWKK